MAFSPADTEYLLCCFPSLVRSFKGYSVNSYQPPGVPRIEKVPLPQEIRSCFGLPSPHNGDSDDEMDSNLHPVRPRFETKITNKMDAELLAGKENSQATKNAVSSVSVQPLTPVRFQPPEAPLLRDRATQSPTPKPAAGLDLRGKENRKNSTPEKHTGPPSPSLSAKKSGGCFLPSPLGTPDSNRNALSAFKGKGRSLGSDSESDDEQDLMRWMQPVYVHCFPSRFSVDFLAAYLRSPILRNPLWKTMTRS